MDAGENLNRMCHSHVQKNVIATGGVENKVKLFDLEKQKQIFLEKNLPHDWLNLRRPVWISDLNFLPETQQIASVGRYGHVRNTILPFVKLILYIIYNRISTIVLLIHAYHKDTPVRPTFPKTSCSGYDSAR